MGYPMASVRPALGRHYHFRQMPDDPPANYPGHPLILPPGTRLGGRTTALNRLRGEHSCLVSFAGPPYPPPVTNSDSAASGVFPHTHWSVVLAAKEQSDAALEHLCRTYREPLLVFLRRETGAAEAEEYFQGFMLALLKRDFLKNVGQDKGRFRTFLIRSLKNYLRDQHRARTTQRRDISKEAGSLDEVREDGRPVHDPAAPVDTPEVEFDKQWARAVLGNAQQRLKDEWGKQGKAALWEALLPALWREPGTEAFDDLGARLGFSAGNLRVILHRLRQQLRYEIEEEVRQTVAAEADWKEEVRYLISLFG